MAITTYSELESAVSNWLHDTTLSTRIPELIALAEDRIYNDPRFRLRFMETSADLALVSTQQTAALPTRYLRTRRLYLNVSPIRVLTYLPPFDFWQTYESGVTSMPANYTIEGENFVFGPYPDASYTGKCLYYERPAALSGASDTNWILTNARGLLLYATLAEAAPYLEDDARVMTWASLYDDIMDKVVASDKADRHSGSPLQMQMASNHFGI